MSLQSRLHAVVPKVVDPTEFAALDPFDGMQVLLQAEAGTKWHMRWNEAWVGDYQWEFLGGPPMHTFFEGSTNADNTPNGAWRNLDGGLPQLFGPRPGVYIARYGGEIGAPADGVSAIIGLGLDGADPVNVDRIFQYNTRIASVATENQVEVSGTLRMRLHYWRGDSAGNDAIFGHRYISIVPVRLS